jgi:hypothetical protein
LVKFGKTWIFKLNLAKFGITWQNMAI